MKTLLALALVLVALVVLTSAASAQNSTTIYDRSGRSLGTVPRQDQGDGTVRFYDGRGNVIGTATTSPSGQTRFYDSRGNSLGTGTTSPSGETRFYDSRGNVIGTATMPPPPAPSRSR